MKNGMRSSEKPNFYEQFDHAELVIVTSLFLVGEGLFIVLPLTLIFPALNVPGNAVAAWIFGGILTAAVFFGLFYIHMRKKGYEEETKAIEAIDEEEYQNFLDLVYGRK